MNLTTVEGQAMVGWAESEKERRFDVEKGLAVVANIDKDGDINLVEWAKQEGIYLFIGNNRSKINWRNIFEIGGDYDRDEACDDYIRFFKYKSHLHRHIKHLKGKVLGCYCYPKRCHGDYLAYLANSLNIQMTQGRQSKIEAWKKML